MRNFTFILIIITFLASACYKDIDNTTIIKKERPPHIVVDTELFGTYTSQNASISKLILQFGENTFEAIDGQLPLIKLQAAQKRGEFIELYTGGKRAGAVQVGLIENDINYTNILVSNNFETTAITGSSSVELDSKLSFSFMDALFVSLTGQAFTGSMISEHGFSEDDLYNNQVSSYAFDQLGNLSVLDVKASFFTAVVAEDGSDLKMDSGELQVNSDYGDDVQLFHFNKEEKSWEWVSDFTSGINSQKILDLGWFVIASAASANYLEAKIQIAASEVVNQKVELKAGAYEKHLFSTSGGRFGGFVPLESDIAVNVLDKSGRSFFENTITANQALADIVVTIPEEEASKNFIRGDFQVIDCEGAILEDKILTIRYDEVNAEQFALGDSESSWIPVEQEVFSISSGDGPSVNWSTSQKEIHYLSSCDNHSEGFSMIKIRGDQKFFPAFQRSISEGRTLINSVNGEVKFFIDTDSKGVYNADMTNISINDDSFGSQGYFVSCENAMQGCGINICEITHSKSDGDEWDRMYFQGKVWMQTIAPALSGNFEVEGYILSKQ